MQSAAAAASGVKKRADAIRMLGVSERQVRAWEKANLLAPAEEYSFGQLAALRKLAKFKANGISPKRLRGILDAAARRMPDVADPLSELTVYADGKKLRVQRGKERMEPSSGQLLLDLDPSTEAVVLPPRIQDDPATKQRKAQDAETWFLRGVEFEQKGTPQEAIDCYDVAVALDPAFAAAHVNLGTIYFGQQDWQRAQKFYERAIEANPDYPLAHFNLGNLHDERGRKDQALAHYLTALKLDPAYADAHYNVALLYQTTGQAMKAMRHWRSYLKLDPSSSWAEVAKRELDKLYKSAVVRGKKDPA